VSAEPRFPYVLLDARAERAEELGYAFFELGAVGVEVRDDSTWDRGPGGGVVRLCASFASDEDARAAHAALLATEPELACSLGEYVGDRWRDQYKDYFKPFALAPRLTVAPPWEIPAPPAGELLLVMDPGRAFGTGRHPTTAMVAAELAAADLAGAVVLDVGTGSGVLALAALLFGAARAVAIDNDPEVLEVARDNARRNGLGARMEVSATPLAEVVGAFDVVLANIRSEVLIGMEPDIARVARAGALVVLSGVLADEADGVGARFASRFELVARRVHDEGADRWVALALRRRGEDGAA
jgi:ribosomal protein L11 methyltransferase